MEQFNALMETTDPTVLWGVGLGLLLIIFSMLLLIRSKMETKKLAKYKNKVLDLKKDTPLYWAFDLKDVDLVTPDKKSRMPVPNEFTTDELNAMLETKFSELWKINPDVELCKCVVELKLDTTERASLVSMLNNAKSFQQGALDAFRNTENATDSETALYASNNYETKVTMIGKTINGIFDWVLNLPEKREGAL